MGVLLAVVGTLGAAAPWTPSDSVKAQDKLLSDAQPDVVVVGNSLAASDVDLKALQQATGLKAATLRENASPGPTWYTLLKFRLFEAGYRPKVILVVSSLNAMLRTRPDGEMGMARLQQHFAEPDDVLARKLLGGNPRWRRMKERRTQLRASILDDLKYTVAGSKADEDLEKVFDMAAVLSGGPTQVMPIVEQEAVSTETATGIEASFILDIIELGKKNGAKVIFVRVPVAPASARYDMVPMDVQREVVQAINTAGGGWLDLSGLPVSEADFRDGRHMAAGGASRFTQVLLERLEKMGAFSAGSLAQAALPLVPDILQREGQSSVMGEASRVVEAPCGQMMGVGAMKALTDAALMEAGLRVPSPLMVLENGRPLRKKTSRADLGPECHGAYAAFANGMRFSGTQTEATWSLGLDPSFPMETPAERVWWLYPGTTLRIGFSESWDRGAFSVNLWGRRLGDGSGQVQVALKGGPSVPMSGEDRLEAHLEAAAPQNTWEIQISSPEDGPFVLLQKFLLGEGSEAVALLSPTPKVSSLLKTPLSCGTAPRVAQAPEAIPPKKQGDPWHISLPDLQMLANKQAADLAGDWASSPVRLWLGGQRLERVKLGALKPGSYNHQEGEIRYVPPEGADPKDIQIALDPEHLTAQGAWIYPGDTCTIQVSAAKLRQTVQALLLAGGSLSPPPEGAVLSVELLKGEEKLIAAQVDWAAAMHGIHWALPTGMREDFIVRLQSSAEMPYVFLKQLAVSDSPEL